MTSLISSQQPQVPKRLTKPYEFYLPILDSDQINAFEMYLKQEIKNL